jgi:hypothetical protein
MSPELSVNHADILDEREQDVEVNGKLLRALRSERRPRAGRIDGPRCDLSPDGALLVCKLYQGNRSSTEYTDCWTAISRPPWLHALALWPLGTTYGGGGRFVGDRRVVLRGATTLHPDHPVDPARLNVVEGDAPPHVSNDNVPGAEWAGRDQRDRLVHATDGQLFVRIGSRDLALADFRTEVVPAPVPAPAWATRPL